MTYIHHDEYINHDDIHAVRGTMMLYIEATYLDLIFVSTKLICCLELG